MKLPARIGKYELEKFLGGGMSHAYRARDTVLGRIVAVKILTEEGCADVEAKVRFLQEARMAGNLEHDNVIAIYDFGEDDQQRPYMVMEFLRGEDLRQAIRGTRVGDLANKLRIALQIARAIGFIHEHKIIHRDIKPENIYLTPNGVVKLMDFGIAKTAGLNMTRTGFVMGTPFYMAPEQVLGKNIDERVDIYAFGVLFFELLAGVRPFTGETVDRLFYSILNEPMNLGPLRMTDTPVAIVDLIARCTAKNPDERPQDFAKICEELEKIQQELEFVSEPEPKPADKEAPTIPEVSSDDRPHLKRLWRLSAVLALVVVSAVVVAFYLFNKHNVATVPRQNSMADKTTTPSTADYREAVILKRIQPIYTEAAQRAHVHGVVVLSGVVGRDGRLQKNLQVIRSLGYGLDEAAREAALQYEFRAAALGGQAVDSTITLTFTFQ